ncbi:PIM1 kinase, partial [Acrocephalus arundinaceus]|nr:PIM1 kinase [Acrocephalus arundinaceus]
SPAGKAQEVLQERYRVGSLLGRGSFGSICTGTQLLDGTPVSGRARAEGGGGWCLGPKETSAPLEIVLLDKVSTGCAGVILLLERAELPNGFLLVLECS